MIGSSQSDRAMASTGHTTIWIHIGTLSLTSSINSTRLSTMWPTTTMVKYGGALPALNGGRDVLRAVRSAIW